MDDHAESMRGNAPLVTVDIPVARPHIPIIIQPTKRTTHHRFGNPHIPSIVLGVRYPVSSPETRRLRVGIWLLNTDHYSGGRIFLYQYAACLAASDLVDVFIVTTQRPLWARDYPHYDDRIHYLIMGGSGRVPDDLDIIISDKSGLSKEALTYKLTHPNCVLVGMSFETPNWVNTLCPELGHLMRGDTTYKWMARCDHLFTCSEEGAGWLHRYIEETCGKDSTVPITAFSPAVNTFALEAAKSGKGIHQHVLDITQKCERKYALWVARNILHKNLELCIDTLWALNEPCDLVVIGSATKQIANTSKHHLHFFKGIRDSEKFVLMLRAHTVLAPSLFEGYGIVPGEALASGVVPVVFDLPVLRQVYGNRLDYIPYGDTIAYSSHIASVMKSAKHFADAPEACDKFGMDAMRKRVYRLPYHNLDRVSITAQFIVYWGFVPEAVEAIYDQVDQIVIAYGPVDLVRKRGVAPDNSLELIRALSDPDHKIEVYPRDLWLDKTEMHNFCCRKVRGNRMLICGGDQIWVGLDTWAADAKIYADCPRMVHFWEDDTKYIAEAPDGSGRNWGISVTPFGTFAPHCLWTYWRPSFFFRCQSQVCDAGKRDVNHRPTFEERKAACDRHPETVIYHLGNVLPDRIMKAKAQFYLDRDKCPDRQRMTGQVLPVTWELPAIVKRAFDRLGVRRGVDSHVG